MLVHQFYFSIFYSFLPNKYVYIFSVNLIFIISFYFFFFICIISIKIFLYHCNKTIDLKLFFRFKINIFFWISEQWVERQ